MKRESPARRRVFQAATILLGLSLGDAAARVGCTYNHLMLVLDGLRKPSARLDAAINGVILEARPLILASFGTAESRSVAGRDAVQVR